jgi:hypothetical protein
MKDDVGVVVAYYSPCGYSLPEQHLLRTLNDLAVARTQSCFIQVCRHDQKPISLRAGVGCITESVFYSDHAVFWKENLWNIAASMLPHDKLVFIDSDVVFHTPGWIHEASRLLDEYDVIQPFEDGVYLDKEGGASVYRKSSAMALATGVEPVADKYHPGFAWCMTRRAFDAMGGFYDRNPVGGGDVGFAYALDQRWADTDLPTKIPQDLAFWSSNSYQAYRQRGFAAGLKVGYIPGLTVSHQWHGDLENRQYVTRASYLPEMVDGEYPLHYRYDGLIEWDKIEDSNRLREYFVSRREDG